MKIEVFLDAVEKPIATVTPPERFSLDTENLDDGPHELRFVATGDDGISSLRTVSFSVQNGPAISVHGIVDGDTVHGKVSVLTNAYGSTIGDEFEPMRIETPTPIPTWAWVLCLSVLAWGVGYVSLELHNNRALPAILTTPTAAAPPLTSAALDDEVGGWKELGAQVYGNNCSSCHQVSGGGLPGVFPPLKGNSTVTAEDPAEHIRSILFGVSNKVIDGVEYMAPMPAFGAILSDDEVAAVVNHERTQWGNKAPTITKDDVVGLRK